MARDKEIDDLLLELQKDIVRVSDNKLSKEIKEVYKEEVDYAYSEYQPTMYQRRYAFADENNWDMNVELGKDDIELTLINETDAVNSKERLDKIIETGEGYDWTDNVPARPIYERTQDRLESEQVVENILESELKKLGYDFK